MSDPVFESRTPRLDLPYLFAGQTQKELFVNESLARLDGLLYCAVEGVANSPPVGPVDGECWLVGTSPTGPWDGKAGSLAFFQAGNWLFQQPRDGLRVLDRTTGQDRRFHNGWQAANRPPVPSGGTTIDIEARASITALFDSLATAGILTHI